MEFFLEHVHVYSGMPWWGSIIATTLVVRLVFFKLFMGASDNAAKLATISHLTKPIMEKQKVAMARNDTAEVMRLRSENALIMNRAGVKMWRSFAPMISVFTGYGTFVLLRAMANLPVPGLEDGGILWFQNLAVADPYYILPLITSAVLHIAIKVRSPFLLQLYRILLGVLEANIPKRAAVRLALTPCHKLLCAQSPSSFPASLSSSPPSCLLAYNFPSSSRVSSPICKAGSFESLPFAPASISPPCLSPRLPLPLHLAQAQHRRTKAA